MDDDDYKRIEQGEPEYGVPFAIVLVIIILIFFL